MHVCTSTMCFSFFVGVGAFLLRYLHLYVDHMVCSSVGSFPSCVTEWDWHSDARGLDALCVCVCVCMYLGGGADGERRVFMLNAKGEIMLWH